MLFLCVRVETHTSDPALSGAWNLGFPRFGLTLLLPFFLIDLCCLGGGEREVILLS